MHVEIITPEHKIFTGEAEAIQLPGKEGLFQLLDKHAPIISTLTKGQVKLNLTGAASVKEIPGVIELDKSNNKLAYVHIKGGVVECQNNKVIVLAD